MVQKGMWNSTIPEKGIIAPVEGIGTSPHVSHDTSASRLQQAPCRQRRDLWQVDRPAIFNCRTAFETRQLEPRKACILTFKYSKQVTAPRHAKATSSTSQFHPFLLPRSTYLPKSTCQKSFFSERQRVSRAFPLNSGCRPLYGRSTRLPSLPSIGKILYFPKSFSPRKNWRSQVQPSATARNNWLLVFSVRYPNHPIYHTFSDRISIYRGLS